MSIFGKSAFGPSASSGSFYTWSGGAVNANKDIEVPSAPDESISSISWSPTGMFFVAGSWNNSVRCWEFQNGQAVPKAEQTSQPHTQPVLHVSWNDDGTKVLTASCDKTAKIWDLNSNQAVQIAQHDQPVRTVHWIKSPSYTCAMTTSWDKTVKFWDTRTANPILTLQLPERAYSADVDYPMAVVATAGKKLVVYQLDGEPKEFKTYDSQLKFQSRTVSIFRDKKTNMPAGFALGGIEGRVAITLIQPANAKDNFSFKCHRSTPTGTTTAQEIFPVNDICFHPTFGTLATVGSDGRFSFWDKDVRTRLKTSDQMNMPITACALDSTGKAFAYATSYDWSQGHEGFNKDTMKPAIYIRDCYEDFKPNNRK